MLVKTQQSLVILGLCLKKIRTGKKSHEYCDVTVFKLFFLHTKRKAGVFKFLRFEECFRKFVRFRDEFVWRVVLHRRNKAAISIFSDLKNVFEKLRFRDVLVWTVGLTAEIKLRFQISSAPNSPSFCRVRSRKLPKLLAMQTLRHTSSWNYGKRLFGYESFLFSSGPAQQQKRRKTEKTATRKKQLPLLKRLLYWELFSICYNVAVNIKFIGTSSFSVFWQKKKISASRTRQTTISHLVTRKKEVVCNLAPSVFHTAALQERGWVELSFERFSIECRKTKTRVITLANHKGQTIQ